MEHDANKHMQDKLDDCIEGFLLLFVDNDIYLDIKEWMSEVKKPRNMSIPDFVQQINHLKDLIEYTLISDPKNDLVKQTPKFTDT